MQMSVLVPITQDDLDRVAGYCRKAPMPRHTMLALALHLGIDAVIRNGPTMAILQRPDDGHPPAPTMAIL